ncbi:uracil permease [Paenibacillus larvae]|uniref:Uracil permease n=3 Tax=Paenibacillus larvae TaxID=1464 RepID=URAP_PAELB|nr:uracil permease [Paenibacillus larvae]A0A2A5K1W4.1 RecName: Full=Uracil permease; AltName: Full=Paenibacillus larvae uracil permease; Short=PlUP; AltName: Full=Uracil transporter [Paenibacillus larvae subsp. larvae B-3650]AQR77573.1 uracil/xanthine transporter [Paenibacillus larvae subsp. larvae]AVF21365.1 uracil permease UraA [Paenibacillus larvae subsp. larvae]ETK30153.1 uracil permease UraA [Paenibacillus larvae subsp. larvae DSM 25719]MCY7477185.1 uracil permease [Paenibacillus larvae]
MKDRVIQVDERLPFLQSIPLSLQHLFAMFGSTVLVPMLLQINPAICLLMNGIGTLIYIFLCKGRIPAYLGSSFAFISPVLIVISTRSYEAALSGFLVVGLVFCLIGLLVKAVGTGWIEIVFPPAAMGAIVAVIGLELAPTAANMAGFVASAGTEGWSPDPKVIAVSLVTLLTAVVGNVMFRGFMKIIPILISIIVGYALAAFLGIVDFSIVREAKWFDLPTFYIMKWDWSSIAIIVPAALVVVAEHIGHLIVTSNIVGKDLSKDPGLDRSLLGNGVSTVISSFVGSTPNTTYGENIGVLALTRVYSIWIIGGAAVMAIVLSFVGKLAALIQTIPVPVMGGVSILLFGVIAGSGVRMLVEAKVDYSNPKNLILTAVVLIIGISGAAFKWGNFEMKGMALATVIAILLGLFFNIIDKLKWSNE